MRMGAVRRRNRSVAAGLCSVEHKDKDSPAAAQQESASRPPPVSAKRSNRPRRPHPRSSETSERKNEQTCQRTCLSPLGDVCAYRSGGRVVACQFDGIVPGYRALVHVPSSAWGRPIHLPVAGRLPGPFVYAVFTRDAYGQRISLERAKALRIWNVMGEGRGPPRGLHPALRSFCAVPATQAVPVGGQPV